MICILKLASFIRFYFHYNWWISLTGGRRIPRQDAICWYLQNRRSTVTRLLHTSQHKGTRADRPHTQHWIPAALRSGGWSYRTDTAPEDSLTHKIKAEPPNFDRANPREGSWDRRGPERHLARAGGGPRTGLDSRPPAARLSLQYGRYSLPRWSSSLISTPDLDDGDFLYRSELVRIHCTYSYTHFNGKLGALALRSDETTVPFASTFRTGVGRGRGLAGEPRSLRRAPRRPRLAFLWMEGGHTEWTAYTERLAAIFAGEIGVRGPGGGGRKRAASARGAKFCGAGGGSGWARLPSFRRDPPAQPHPGIGFPVGESRATRIPPTFVP